MMLMAKTGLSDRRGHHKTDDEVDELERLRRENMRLKRQLEEKDMAGRTVKKSERIRRDVRLGKQRFESKYHGNSIFLPKKGNGASTGCANNWEFHVLLTINGYTGQFLKQEEENIKLAELIKEYDERFCHILGYRRMTSWINHFNHTNYSKNRIHRIMKKLGIHSVIRKKKKKYHSSKPETTAENKLKRDFNAAKT